MSLSLFLFPDQFERWQRTGYGSLGRQIQGRSGAICMDWFGSHTWGIFPDNEAWYEHWIRLPLCTDSIFDFVLQSSTDNVGCFLAYSAQVTFYSSNLNSNDITSWNRPRKAATQSCKEAPLSLSTFSHFISNKIYDFMETTNFGRQAI